MRQLRELILKLMLKYPYVFWLLGLLYPLYYFGYFLSARFVWNNFKKRDRVLSFLYILLFLQILSVTISVVYPFFSFERFAAISHNILSFSFVFLGYSLLKNRSTFALVQKGIPSLFFMFALLCLIGAAYTFITSNALTLRTFPQLFGIDNKFTQAVFSTPRWYFFGDFPRIQVFGFYPNGTGVLLIIIYSIYLNFVNFKKHYVYNKLSVYLYVLLIFLTGSRTFLVLALGLVVVMFIKNRTRLWLLVLVIPLVLLFLVSFIAFLMTGREGSNEARYMIYFKSFQLMWDYNPFTGLGIKPKMEEFFPYPVGSHSTLWGYVVKLGMMSIVVVIAYLKQFVKFLYYVYSLINSKVVFNQKLLIMRYNFICVLLASVFEDFDSMEMIPFFAGILLWQNFNIDEFEYNLK